MAHRPARQPPRRDASYAACIARLEAAPKPSPAGFAPVSDAGAAAVLVPLFRGPAGEARVLLTQRAAHLKSHAGEVALPGGRLEPGETPTEGALREACEEVGLAPSRVRVVAHLPPVLSKHRLSVSIVVGAVDDDGGSDGFEMPPGLTAAPDEVAAIFAPRLDAFLDAGRRSATRVAHWGPGGPPFRLHWFECVEGDAAVWGLTAGILIEAAQLALGRAAPFEVHAEGVPYNCIVSEGGVVRVRQEG